MTSTRIFEIFLLSVLACGLFCAAPNASTSPEPVDEVLTEESDKELPNVYYGNYKIHHSENCDMNLNLHYGTRFDLEHLDMTIAFVKSNQKHKFNVKYSKNKKNGKLDNVEFGKPIKAGETQLIFIRKNSIIFANYVEIIIKDEFLVLSFNSTLPWFVQPKLFFKRQE